MLFSQNTQRIVEDNTSSTVSSKQELTVSKSGDQISYDLLPLIPTGVEVKKIDLTLRGEDSSGQRKYITSNLQSSARNKTIPGLSSFNNVELSARLEYESNGSLFCLEGKALVVEGDNVSSLDLTEEVGSIQSQDQLVEYLLREINSLKTRIKVLEGGN